MTVLLICMACEHNIMYMSSSSFEGSVPETAGVSLTPSYGPPFLSAVDVPGVNFLLFTSSSF